MHSGPHFNLETFVKSGFLLLRGDRLNKRRKSASSTGGCRGHFAPTCTHARGRLNAGDFTPYVHILTQSRRKLNAARAKASRLRAGATRTCAVQSASQ